MGILDDTRGLPPIVKMLFQISAALLAFFHGIRIESLSILELMLQGKPLALLFTVLWVVTVTNAFNLIDGMDGLSAGCGSICSALMILPAWVFGHTETAGILAALCGACVGFLPHNLRRKKLFLGDTGAQFIGFVLAVLSLDYFFSGGHTVSASAPLLFLAYPLTETVVTVLRRLLRRRDPLTADRGHFHHLLLDHGFSKQETAGLLLLLCLLSCMAGISSSLGSTSSALLILMLGIASLLCRLYLCSPDMLRNHAKQTPDQITKNIDEGKRCSQKNPCKGVFPKSEP